MKVKNKDSLIEYKNLNFLKNQRTMIKKIKRKKRIKKTKSDMNKEIEESLLKEYNKIFEACMKKENEIRNLFEDNKMTYEANKGLREGKSEFVEEIERRIKKLTKGFCMLIYFANRKMITRVYFNMVFRGLATSISKGYGELDQANIRTSIQLRVSKLLFYQSEDNNYLDMFYNCVVNGNTEMETDPQFLEFYNKNQEKINKYIFGEDTRISRLHSESVKSNNSNLIRDVNLEDLNNTFSAEVDQLIDKDTIPNKSNSEGSTVKESLINIQTSVLDYIGKISIYEFLRRTKGAK